MAALSFLMFAAVVVILLAGYPVAFTLAGTALLFAGIGVAAGVFDPVFLETMPNRVFGIMNNVTLIAVPLFVFMGVTLERARIAEDLLETLSMLMGRLRGGLGIAVILVGTLMAASTGIVGATVVTMGLLSLPTMLKRGYGAGIATGTITAARHARTDHPAVDHPGAARRRPVVRVPAGAVAAGYLPARNGLGRRPVHRRLVARAVACRALHRLPAYSWPVSKPQAMPAWSDHGEAPAAGIWMTVAKALLPALLLILAVLGSIVFGLATPTEAAGVGALGGLVLAAARGQLDFARLYGICKSTAKFTCMVFLISDRRVDVLAGVPRLRRRRGDFRSFLTSLPGGTFTAVLVVMLVMFVMGFVLDFIEITFVVVPIVGPALLAMGVDPVWLGIMIAINLQTSFLDAAVRLCAVSICGASRRPRWLRWTSIEA